jgi:chorismate dehydratase
MEYIKGTGKFIIDDISISSKGPVGSVFLLRKNGSLDFNQVGLDNRSRTSVALLKIFLLENGKKIDNLHIYDPRNKVITKSIEDALLLIGDDALIHRQSKFDIDLGEWWFEYTRLPFVFAVWASNKELEPTDLELFRKSKQSGIDNIDRITEIEADKKQLDFDVIKRYLESMLSYDLKNKEIKGINTFQNFLLKHGLIKSTRELILH